MLWCAPGKRGAPHPFVSLFSCSAHYGISVLLTGWQVWSWWNFQTLSLQDIFSHSWKRSAATSRSRKTWEFHFQITMIQLQSLLANESIFVSIHMTPWTFTTLVSCGHSQHSVLLHLMVIIGVLILKKNTYTHRLAALLTNNTRIPACKSSFLPTHPHREIKLNASCFGSNYDSGLTGEWGIEIRTNL